MKLILTDYIASLKEDRELDVLLQDLLREHDFEIIYGPQKGQRQYGVDIYAVGIDPEDKQKKTFLLTVKQGNLDRKNWQGGVQSLEASLKEIATVFIRNNLALEHRALPVKIVVVHNGINDPAIQQNWVGFVEQYPQHQFAIWQLETVVNMVHDQMLTENIFSDENRNLLRKIVVYLFNSDYDLSDYKKMLDEILGQLVADSKAKKQNIKLLRKVTLILSIILSYCEREGDTRLALKASEITQLRVWKFINENEKLIDKDYFNEFIHMLIIRKDTTLLYLSKILPVCEVKDGFSRFSGDSINYNRVTYEHLGFVSLAGLEFLQIADLYENKNDEIVTTLKQFAFKCAEGIINLFNNNRIVFNPRTDDQVIEINLALVLLMKLDKRSDIRTLLLEYNNELAHAKLFLNIAPLYSNNIDELFEMDVFYKKRQKFEYGSSSLLTNLAEWAVAINDKLVYDAYHTLVEKVFTGIDLTLWFPDEKTEESLYTKCALPETGYCLSNIKLTTDFEEFKFITLQDHIHNCYEEEYLFIKNKFWAIGLMASRHYRTFVFPYYWRQFIENKCEIQVLKPT